MRYVWIIKPANLDISPRPRKRGPFVHRTSCRCPKVGKRFCRNDLTRAIKAALAAGVGVTRAEIDSSTGKIVLVLGKSDASTGNPNEWDGADE